MLSRLIRNRSKWRWYRVAMATVHRVGPRVTRRVLYRREIKRAIDKPRTPVLVYTMPKAASTAVTTALQKVEGMSVFHVHILTPASLRNVRQAARARGLRSVNGALANMEDLAFAINAVLIKPRRAAKIISLVREPIAWNLSLYFQALDAFWQIKDAHKNVPMERLLNGFHNKFTHERVLNWFDNELKTSIGVDVYAHQFLTEAGFLRIDSSPYQILVMRSDIDDRIKSRCVAELTGIADISVTPQNVGIEKPYAEIYREFLRRIRLSDEFVDKMLDAKYTRHFFSGDEISCLREKWLNDEGRGRFTNDWSQLATKAQRDFLTAGRDSS